MLPIQRRLQSRYLQSRPQTPPAPLAGIETVVVKITQALPPCSPPGTELILRAAEELSGDCGYLLEGDEGLLEGCDGGLREIGQGGGDNWWAARA